LCEKHSRLKEEGLLLCRKPTAVTVQPFTTSIKRTPEPPPNLFLEPQNLEFWGL
jgi:hypothetical protein